MVLVDTGPLVALFDPADTRHQQSIASLRRIREPLVSTIAVLTEAFYMLGPASPGSGGLRDFLVRGGLSIWFFDAHSLARACELMETYADHPMDFADASLVAAAEALATRKVFTLDRRDFAAYRVRVGHRHQPIEMV